jgi:hypothetical protein
MSHQNGLEVMTLIWEGCGSDKGPKSLWLKYPYQILPTTNSLKLDAFLRSFEVIPKISKVKRGFKGQHILFGVYIYTFESFGVVMLHLQCDMKIAFK